MGGQRDLDGKLTEIDAANVFYRPVKSKKKTVTPRTETIDSSSELSDVEELLQYIQVQKLRYPIPLTDSKMKEFPSDCVQRILHEDPTDDVIRNFLSLFCGELRGRQKKEDKYAMLIYLEESFLLAHVRAERGMSLKEEEGKIELIRRFLDVDNILSAALFEIDDGEIVFSHFTDTGSDAFRNFLGVRKQQYNYEKKNVQVVCYYQGNKGLECKFEFSNEEFADHWLNGEKIHLSGGNFTLEEDRSHQIKEIRWGNETYEAIEAFKSDFKQHMYRLETERKRYEDLLEYPAESDISVFDAESAKDSRHVVTLQDGEHEKIIEKGDYPENLHVVYANTHIELDSGFADDILQDMTNGIETSLYHPSQKAASEEFKCENVTFLNINSQEVSTEFKDFVQKTHNHALNRTGESISKLLDILVLHMISEKVDASFESAIKQIINANTGRPKNEEVVSKKEKEGSGLIEYKAKEDLEKDDPGAVIAQHISTEKGQGFDQKIFLWGVTEQSREINGLRTQQWNDDRVSSIEKAVNDELTNTAIDYNDFLLQPIELGHDGNRWVIAGLLY